MRLPAAPCSPDEGLHLGRKDRAVLDLAHAPHLAQGVFGYRWLGVLQRPAGEHDVAAFELDVGPWRAAFSECALGALGQVLLDAFALDLDRYPAHHHERYQAPQPSPPIASHIVKSDPRFMARANSGAVAAARRPDRRQRPSPAPPARAAAQALSCSLHYRQPHPLFQAPEASPDSCTKGPAEVVFTRVWLR